MANSLLTPHTRDTAMATFHEPSVRHLALATHIPLCCYLHTEHVECRQIHETYLYLSKNNI